jgi:hypothetical protein
MSTKLNPHKHNDAFATIAAALSAACGALITEYHDHKDPLSPSVLACNTLQQIAINNSALHCSSLS